MSTNHGEVPVRVCLIGAGPSGMATIAMLNKLASEGKQCEVTCYDKQEDVGGIWNLTWETGLDKYGEPVHCSMYRDLFSNGPKECLEFPDYTFEEHFQREMPASPPRLVMLDYLKGWWKLHGINFERDVTLKHAVRSVLYDETTETFTVTATNLVKKEDVTKVFDYVIVATSHFSVPHVPYFEGMEKFEGRVLHAHDFRNARQFRGQRLLVVGSSYSAEDMALQCYKFGAKTIDISYRTKPMGFAWPANTREIPLLTKVGATTCYFKDGTSAEYDAIILCTGYQHHFPFMPAEWRLDAQNTLHVPNLYRNLQWYGDHDQKIKKDAGGRLFYLAMTDFYYTYTLFMMNGLWVAHVIKGLLSPPSRDLCLESIQAGLDTNNAFTCCDEKILDQTKSMLQLAADTKFKGKLDVKELFFEWEEHKLTDIVTYRDQVHTSPHTGRASLPPAIPWLKTTDDSIEFYLENVVKKAQKKAQIPA